MLFRSELSVNVNSTLPLTWLWNFGDGSSNSTLQNPPPHIFPGLGNQTVSLTVTNGGCTHTSTITVSLAAVKFGFSSIVFTVIVDV